MAKKYLDHDIPEGRRSLIECRDNLMGISDYCEQNYASANNKRKALEVTQVSAHAKLNKQTTFKFIFHTIGYFISFLSFLIGACSYTLLRLFQPIKISSRVNDRHYIQFFY